MEHQLFFLKNQIILKILFAPIEVWYQGLNGGENLINFGWSGFLQAFGLSSVLYKENIKLYVDFGELFNFGSE